MGDRPVHARVARQDLDTLTEDEQRNLFTAIDALLRMNRPVTLVGRESGSVLLTILLTRDEAGRLLRLIAEGKLAGHGVSLGWVGEADASSRHAPVVPERGPEITAVEWGRYREFLLVRARMFRLGPRLRVRFDEDDLVQETLMRAAQKDLLSGIASDRRLAWLGTVLTNCLCDKVRYEYAQIRDADRTETAGLLLEPSGDELIRRLASAAPSPAEAAGSQETVLDVCQAINELPEREREVMMRLSLLEEDTRMAAEAMGMSLVEVVNIRIRAREKLARRLGKG